MDERVLQFRVGVMVVSSVAIAAILIAIFNYSPAMLSGRYTLHVKFPDAPGVMKDTPVRKSGVLIGRVSDVKLLDDGGVQVSARIDNQYELREHEMCRVGTESLLGNTVLEFVPSGDTSKSTTKLEDGAYIKGDVAGNPLDVLNNLEGDVRNTMVAFQDTSGQVSGLAKNLNQLVETNDEKFAQVLNKSEAALDEIRTAMQSINKVLNPRTQQRLQDSLETVPDLIEESRAAVAAVPQLVAESRAAVAEFHDVARQTKRNLDNMESVANAILKDTGDMFDKVESAFGKVDNAVASFETASGEFEEFSRRLNDPTGTIGLLATNPELYQRLNRAAGNVEHLTQRMRPIVEDVRVFSDKIARDPGRLGVKGALDRGGTGTKFLPLSYLQPATPAPTPAPYYGQPLAPPPTAMPPHAPLYTPQPPPMATPHGYWQHQ